MLSDTPNKAELRRQMRIIREEAAARDPDAADKLADIFPMRLVDRYGPVVAGYMAIKDEMDPAPLLKRLAYRGTRLCLPRIEEDGRMSFRRWSPGDDLIEGKFGTLEPAPDAEEMHPGLVLTPLLAFDGQGGRLGYGKGHYDSALERLRAEGRTFVCALAFQAQQFAEVPTEAHDQPLDWAVTETGSVPIFMARALG